MIFLHPLLLTLGVLVGIPFIIHLLGERKHQVLLFGSLKFLREIERDSLQKLQLRQWLILLSRALWISMLVLALAQPFFTKSGGFLEPGILLIDKSFSTNTDKNFTSTEKRLIENFPRWDIVTYNERTILDSLRYKLRENIESNKRKMPNIILISDFQDNTQNNEIIEIIRSQTTRTFGLLVKKAKENRSLSDIRSTKGSNNKNDLKSIEIHLSQNNKTSYSPFVYVNLNGKQVGRADINEDGVGYFYFSALENENIPCIVTCPEDEYPEDNIRYLVIENNMSIKILCVKENTEIDYHIEALRAIDRVKPTVISPQELTSIDLNDFDMIWFSNLYLLSQNAMKEIKIFSKNKPLLITSGKDLSFPNGWEAITGKLSLAKNEGANFRIENIPGISINEDMIIKQFYQSTHKSNHIIWELAKGDPLLVEAEKNIYLLLSPFHFEWNEMGLSPYFTRVINELVEKVLNVQDLSYELGETIPVREPFSKITSPAGEQYQVKDEFNNTMTPGFYTIENTNGQTIFAVNISKNECVQTVINTDNINMLAWDGNNISDIENQIKGRNSQTIFYILALLFIILEMVLLKKGERTK